jgi:hypothetical protein
VQDASLQHDCVITYVIGGAVGVGLPRSTG